MYQLMIQTGGNGTTNLLTGKHLFALLQQFDKMKVALMY